MTASLIVIDDFLGNPYEIRDIALGLDYPDPGERTAYAGRNSSQRLRIDGLEAEISRIVAEKVEANRDSMHATCRITLAGATGQNTVHVDPGQWSGTLYLTLPEYCTGGTDFFRHLPTGTDGVPITPAEQAATGIFSFRDVFDRILGPDANDSTKWERVLRIPMRFNRLVLFRPWLWHSGGPGFGTSLENGRLVYLMFFLAAGIASVA